MLTSEERQEPDTAIPPQSPLASSIARMESPLQELEDLMKPAIEKKIRKAQAKRKRVTQGKMLPSVTIGRHTRGPSTDDVILLIFYDILTFLLSTI
jgi:hypothetical protein